MTIDINSVEYVCWHEVGHAIACLSFGGEVEHIEILDPNDPRGKAYARCITNPEIRKIVATGGFAAELYLYRNKRLPEINENEMAQILFINATKDREKYWGKTQDDPLTKEEDDEFQHVAFAKVTPLIKKFSDRIEQLVSELIKNRKIEGKRIKEILKI
jgi:hypothetical protein